MKRTITLGLAAVGLLALVAIGCAVHASGPPEEEHRTGYNVLEVEFTELSDTLNALPENCEYRGHGLRYALTEQFAAQVVYECDPTPEPSPTATPTPVPAMSPPSTGGSAPAPTPTPRILTYPGPGGETQCNINGEWYPICVRPDGRYGGCDCHLP